MFDFTDEQLIPDDDVVMDSCDSIDMFPSLNDTIVQRALTRYHPPTFIYEDSTIEQLFAPELIQGK